MKKSIVVCDRCKMEITPGRVISPDEEHDLCEGCATEILRNWFKVPTGFADIGEEKPAGKKKEEPEGNPEGGIEKERKRHWEKVGTGAVKIDPNAPIDRGKAQALRNAGWTAAKIADELGCSVTTVYNITHPATPRKKKQLEFIDDDLARLGNTEPAEIQEELIK